MNILVTGGLGYIGSHTCIKLIESGHNIIIIDNLSNCSANVLESIKKITNHMPSFYRGDIKDNLLLDEIFKDHEINAVIHFAGLKSLPESVKSPLAYYDNNIFGSINLLKSMEKHGVRNIIFSSSASVYGLPKVVPIPENHKLSTTNPYANTKKIIEEILYDLTRSNPLWKVNVLRYFNPVGAHSSSEIGESPTGVPSNLSPYIVKVICGEMPFLPVYGTNYPTIDGTGVRDYIHVEDIADGHLAALKFMGNQTVNFSVFNLGRGKGVSVLEMADAYKKISGIDFEIKTLDPRPGDVAECYADTQKAKLMLNWTAERSLDEMCKSSLAYYKNNCK